MFLPDLRTIFKKQTPKEKQNQLGQRMAVPVLAEDSGLSPESLGLPPPPVPSPDATLQDIPIH